MNSCVKIKLIERIKMFEDYALLTDSLFQKKFDTKERPLIAATRNIIPKKGELDHDGTLITYRFHGNGCEFVFDNGLILDFNYKPTSWNYEGVSVFNLWNFLKNQMPEIESKEVLENHLKELEREEVLIRVKPPYSIYKLKRKATNLSS